MILAAYFLLGLGNSVVVPLAEAPDELDHFHYARYLVEQHAFPPLSPVAEENPTMEANQPPLYYALAGLAGGWIAPADPFTPPQNACYSFDPADSGRQTFYVHTATEAWPFQSAALSFHVMRLLSLLLGGAAVGLAWLLGRQIAPDEPGVGLAAAALLAFNPQFLFITSSVNNDVLASTLGAAITVAAIVLWRRPSAGWAALLGLLLGLGALSKASLLALWPLALLAASGPLVRLLFAPKGEDKQWVAAMRACLWPLLLVGGLPLLIAGWWYVRATLLYGDPLAWRVHLAAKGPFVLREGALDLGDLVAFAVLHFRSYWGLFGWLNVALPGWAYAGLILLGGAALIGLGWGVFACLRRRPCGLDLAAIGFCALAVVTTYISLLRYIQTINWSGYQGRLAFATAAPLAALLAAGLFFLANQVAFRWGRLLFWGGPLFLLGLSLFSVTGVLPQAYPRPGIFQEAALQPACVRFAPGLLLDGYDAPQRIGPGGTLVARLGTFGMEGSAGAGTLAALLQDDAGQVWATGETAVTWQQGETGLVFVPLQAAADTPLGRLTLRAGLQRPDGGWEPATSATGRLLETPPALGTIKVPAPAPQLMGQSQSVDFGDQLGLRAVDLQPDQAGLTVRLVWEGLAPMTTEWTTFVHLLDSAGRLVAQADGPPGEGAYPTTIWDVGEQVVDEKRLSWPSGEIAGPLRLTVGMYDPRDGSRLALDGGGGDTAVLGEWMAIGEIGEN